MGKKDSPKSEWDTGVYDPGAFKLGHLLPVRLILFLKKSTFLTVVLGAPFSYYHRERKQPRCVLILFRPATILPPKTEYMALIYDDW